MFMTIRLTVIVRPTTCRHRSLTHKADHARAVPTPQRGRPVKVEVEMLVATAAAEVPEAVCQRVVGWTAGTILAAPCQRLERHLRCPQPGLPSSLDLGRRSSRTLRCRLAMVIRQRPDHEDVNADDQERPPR